MRMLEKAALRAFAVLAAVTLGSCGGSSGSGSGGGPTIPLPATPAATPTPASTPAPVLSSSCARLPAGTASPTSCRTEAPTFLADVEDAIDTLRGEQPGLFEGNQVLNVGAYYVGLIKILDRKGLCADFDGEELGVTNTRDYSDLYDVQTAKNEVRRFYVGTCYPALVPISRGTPPPSPAGCSLAPSKEIACGREPDGRFYGDVAGGIDQLLKTRPELFDLDRRQPRHGLAPGEGHERLPRGHGRRISAARGICGRLRRRGDPAEADERLHRALRRELLGQVHPDGLGDLPGKPATPRPSDARPVAPGLEPGRSADCRGTSRALAACGRSPAGCRTAR